ncbi:MAG: thioredoxin family protein [Polyangiaceae bacterium]|nr:thioredoxin family protein [Polyangiaceae bacterium]
MLLNSNGEMPIGMAMPSFALPDTVSEKMVASSEFAGEPLVVAFWCNHCPYVKHIRNEFVLFARECAKQGVRVVAISSNDEVKYPQDGPVAMAAEARSAGYEFPYLFDASQETAKAFGAACTPDLYLFDAAGKLFYHGQFDESRPSAAVAVTGSDLRGAVALLLANHSPPSRQRPSVGCSIKWRPGNAPSYA